MKFYSVDFIRKCVFLLKKEYFLLRKVSVSAMQPFFYHYACYLCCNIIKTSKIC